MKPGYKWFQYLMPSSYSLSALAGIQFGHNQNIISVSKNNVTTNMTVAAYIEKLYDFRPGKKYEFVVGLLVFWVVLQFFIYLTFKFVSHLKR
ncbi:Pleiotropic drug resistance protein ABC Superfamily [Phytophthora palmivora]|uniref:Pleiotropic drug resistance protein ABC Superfamily n=1 Tax=Phytophthora palmivora TaxID=4796 RepID=A0A2P4YUQ7_9STRA|nr:Pleiotropic drug resistance protein ABC Superfamily [Phytophthora palmivora]